MECDLVVVALQDSPRVSPLVHYGSLSSVTDMQPAAHYTSQELDRTRGGLLLT